MAGRGGWKKRRPSCNEADRSWDITPRESGLTSVWSLITGELGEPPSRGNANDGQARTGWCALSRDERGVAASAYREGVTRFTRRTASPREGRLRGLSRVKGNFHARFLGGGAAAMPPCYPARNDSIPLRFAFGERKAECKGEKGISYQPKVATPLASDYGQATKIHLKRRELEPAKPAEGCESNRRQAQNGTYPHSATQSTRAWFSPDTYEGHGVEYRPGVTQYGYTERSNPSRFSPRESRRPGRIP